MSILAIAPLLIASVSAVAIRAVRWADKRSYKLFAAAVLTADFGVTAIVSALQGRGISLLLLTIAEPLRLWFDVDSFGSLIAMVIAAVWLLAGIYSLWYMEHSSRMREFLSWYIIVGAIITEICYAGNLFTFYVFFEFMTLISAFLVIHNRTAEAIQAAKKYMFYSFAGAFMTLFGFFKFMQMGNDMIFAAEGSMTADAPEYLFAVFLMIIGFGTKAGMFPMHGWLPTAHPVAPAPASAVLSGAITKMGVLGIIRAVYFTVGADYLRGTWVQYAWMVLALITILLGSVMAYREDVLKKRIAYSTVSQVSYVLFGLSLLTQDAFTGAVLHMTFHSIIKSTLFILAGTIIVQTDCERVSGLDGIGRKMPVTMWCFTLASVALVGIPPMSPFLSKWFLAVGSLGTGIRIFDWLGPVVLLISALFTALYLLTISLRAFLGRECDSECQDPPLIATVPVIIFVVAAVLLGIWPVPLINAIQTVCAGIF